MKGRPGSSRPNVGQLAGGWNLTKPDIAAALRTNGRFDYLIKESNAGRSTNRAARSARWTFRLSTRKPATRPKPPALARERRTLTEEPAAPTAVAPEMETSSPEPQAAGEDGASEAGATDSVEEEEFE